MKSTKSCLADIERLKHELDKSEAVVIGAGAGLSASAGFTYSGKRFQDNFQDFIDKYGFADMYSAGFYPFQILEEHWAYWSRYIWLNRYTPANRSVYESLLALVKNKNYFVLTTNVDHQFQKAGFDKERLFYAYWGGMACGSALCPAIRKPTKTRPLSGKWYPASRTCVCPQSWFPAARCACVYDHEFAGG